MSEPNRYKDETEIARDALLAWDGASNPRGLLRSLTAMVDWYYDVGRGGRNKDGSPHAPLVLMQGQILWLLGMGVGNVNEVDVTAALTRCRDILEGR